MIVRRLNLRNYEHMFVNKMRSAYNWPIERAVPSQSLRGDWRVPMDKLTLLLLLAAAVLVLAVALVVLLTR